MMLMFELFIITLLVFSVTNVPLKDDDHPCVGNPLTLDQCQEDMGNKKPVDKQIIYLEDIERPGHWYFPYEHFNGEFYIDVHPHPKDDIIETEERWAAWKWRQCRSNIVCLESARERWSSYYLYMENGGYLDYTPVPQNEDWAQNSIIHYNEQSGIIKLMNHWNDELFGARLYIPPRCFGWRLAAEYINPRNTSSTFDYTMTKGISKSSYESDRHTASVGADMVYEIVKAISAGLGSSYSYTYTWEETSAESQTESFTSSTEVAPGEHIQIWQKATSYAGYYTWLSSLKTAICTVDKNKTTAENKYFSKYLVA